MRCVVALLVDVVVVKVAQIPHILVDIIRGVRNLRWA